MFSLCLWAAEKVVVLSTALANRCKVINFYLITLTGKLIIKPLITYNKY